jgi:hypothetical protein
MEAPKMPRTTDPRCAGTEDSLRVRATAIAIVATVMHVLKAPHMDDDDPAVARAIDDVKIFLGRFSLGLPRL